MRLYTFLGREHRLLVNSDENSHPYKKWIYNYSLDTFQASAMQTEDLLDKLSASCEELGIIENLYFQAMKLEIEFFSAQLLLQPTILPLSKACSPSGYRLMIFSDFDLTCTVVNSSAILAEIAIVTAPKSIGKSGFCEYEAHGGSSRGSVYTEEYGQCIETILLTQKAMAYEIADSTVDEYHAGNGIGDRHRPLTRR